VQQLPRGEYVSYDNMQNSRRIMSAVTFEHFSSWSDVRSDLIIELCIYSGYNETKPVPTYNTPTVGTHKP